MTRCSGVIETIFCAMVTADVVGVSNGGNACEGRRAGGGSIEYKETVDPSRVSPEAISTDYEYRELE